MMTDRELEALWKDAERGEVDDLIDQIAAAALEESYEVDDAELERLAFAAFKLGYLAARQFFYLHPQPTIDGGG
jgi:hypothetical protein